MKQAKRRPFRHVFQEPEFWKILKRVDVPHEPEMLDFILDSCAQQLTAAIDQEIIDQLYLEATNQSTGTIL